MRQIPNPVGLRGLLLVCYILSEEVSVIVYFCWREQQIA